MQQSTHPNFIYICKFWCQIRKGFKLHKTMVFCLTLVGKKQLIVCFVLHNLLILCLVYLIHWEIIVPELLDLYFLGISAFIPFYSDLYMYYHNLGRAKQWWREGDIFFILQKIHKQWEHFKKIVNTAISGPYIISRGFLEVWKILYFFYWTLSLSNNLSVNHRWLHWENLTNLAII